MLSLSLSLALFWTRNEGPRLSVSLSLSVSLCLSLSLSVSVCLCLSLSSSVSLCLVLLKRPFALRLFRDAFFCHVTTVTEKNLSVIRKCTSNSMRGLVRPTARQGWRSEQKSKDGVGGGGKNLPRSGLR